ncbi:MAG: hypothetical protein AB4062_08035 [Crocosphaera sp.]
MKKTYKILMGTLLLLQLGTPALAQNKQAKDSFERFYHESCIPGATAVGFSQSEAAEICTCTVKTLREKYPTDEAFSPVYTRYTNGDQTARITLTRYGEVCYDNILWEN